MPGVDLKRSHGKFEAIQQPSRRAIGKRGAATVSVFERRVMSRVLGWGPAAFWAAVLFLLSELQGGGGVPAGADKLVHGGLYLILGLFLAWGKARTGFAGPAFLLWIMGAGYGALDEWHQSFVPGRDVSVGDWMANSVGVMLGLVLFPTFSARFRDSGRSPSKGTTTTGSA